MNAVLSGTTSDARVPAGHTSSICCLMMSRGAAAINQSLINQPIGYSS